MLVSCSTTISASMSRRWGGIRRVIQLALVVGSALTPRLNPVLWKGMTRLVSVPVAYLLGLRSSFGPQLILVGALELVQVRADRTRGTAGLSKKLRLKEGSQKMTYHLGRGAQILRMGRHLFSMPSECARSLVRTPAKGRGQT